jgi:hypothetical protein
MSGDSRWTGGPANREWQRGTRLAREPLTRLYLLEQVQAYLRDCRGAADLDPRYHPTPAGAVKVIYHQGAAQAAQITSAFEAISKKSVSSHTRTMN